MRPGVSNPLGMGETKCVSTKPLGISWSNDCGDSNCIIQTVFPRTKSEVVEELPDGEEYTTCH